MGDDRDGWTSGIVHRPLGVFTRRQALDAGSTEGEVRARRASKRWRCLHRGVYSASAVPTTERTLHAELCAAICLACASLVVSHRSAALILGLDLVGPVGDACFTTTSGSGSHIGGVHVREGTVISDDLVRVKHMLVTTPTRTVVDLAATAPFRDGVVAADSALRRRFTAPDSLLDAVQELPERLRGRALRVVDFADGSSESAGESLTRVLMHDGRLPPPELNVWIGRDRVDFLFRDARVIVEFDGRLKYTSPEVLWQEKLRQERLAQQGYEVIRVTWDDVVLRPAQTLARIRAAIARSAARTR